MSSNPIVFRYSAIDTAHRCLRRYKLQYVDKLQVDGLESGDMSFGTALHTGLQASLEGDNGLQTFQMYWDGVQHKKMAYSRVNWEQMADAGEVFMTRFDRLHKKHFEPQALEQTMRGMVGAYQFEGTPDYVGKYKGRNAVIDFKTANREYGKEKIQLNEQMPIYSALAKQTLNFDAELFVYYVFIKPEQRIQVIVHEVTPDWLKDRLDNVELMAKELINRTVFPKNPNSCMMGSYKCPYYDTCHGEKK